ncbi:MAG: LysR family transcriptional regulator [Bdellovibrio sp.]
MNLKNKEHRLNKKTEQNWHYTSSLSESIKRLEADLKIKLFYRSRNGITLTPNGRMVTIGCHPVVASYSLPAALQALSTKAPDYKIHLKHGSSRNIQTLIQMGQIDIGVVVNPTAVPDLIIRKLAYDEVCVWSSERKSEKLICHMDLFQTQYVLRKWKNHPTEIIDALTKSLS